ncbi:MAG TPA: RDD family protein [Polyangiaceae bacterium]|nr:RDD family protein [Polyangiaceae bacterium]
MKANTAEKLGAQPLNPYAAPIDAATPPIGQNDQGGELATPSSRLGAQIIDGLLLGAAVIPGALVGAVLGSVFSYGNKDDSPVTMASVLGALTGLLFSIYQWQLTAVTGQSLGKRWSNVRIVLENGEPPGFLRGVVLRSWVLFAFRVIPGLGSLVGLTDALMIFSDGRRCLHDRIAGTRVLKA